MRSEKVVEETKKFVRTQLEHEGSGHDWWHIYRVHAYACALLQQEDADRLTVELAALLHDIADWKLHGGDESVGPSEARRWLLSLQVEENVINHVCLIIQTLSFKGVGVSSNMSTREGKIVQDADRLDALGALGIARAFTYGGCKQRAIHDPEYLPIMHNTAAAYKKNTSPTIAHFYEKLLHLKNLMNTEAARKVAEDRHSYMEQFLKRFFAEWEGDDMNRVLAAASHDTLAHEQQR